MNNFNLNHVIKDPVHGTMQFSTAEDNWIKPFIDSANFQRLRHIKQLGMGDFIFPGAVHTRFNHCIGCSYVASQISHKIGLSEDDRQLVVIACLLHDIGHGPFSHAFEDLFHHKMIRHEAWTPFFLADYRQPEFISAYNKRNPRHQLNQEKMTLIEDMIMHRSPKKRVLADIVSSQMDADRLDYLLRDSHFCGVNYGEFDFRWLLNCMTAINTKLGLRLGISHKGIGAVEHYLMARRLMVRNIYHYQKKLALEFLLVQLLTVLAKCVETDPLFHDIKISRLGRLLIAANHFNLAVSAHANPEALRETFLQNNYQDYRTLCDYDVFAVIRQLAELDDKHPACQLAQRLHTRQIPKTIRLDAMDLSVAEAILAEFKEASGNDFSNWQLAIIKTPHQSYSNMADPILVLNESGSVTPINRMSIAINAISDKYENTALLCIDHVISKDARILRLLNRFSE